MTKLQWAMLGVLAATVGCGDSDPTGGGGAGGGEPSACEPFAEAWCAAPRSCCESEGSFDEAGCRSVMADLCAKSEAVSGSRIDESVIPECVATVKAFYDKCESTTWADKVTHRKATGEKCVLYPGTKAAGEACTSYLECAAPSTPSHWRVCENGVCGEKGYGVGGAACGPCDTGLYCDSGTCKAIVLALGDTCDASDWASNFECGFGAYCHPDTSVCTLATKGEGDPCESFLECQALSCIGTPAACSNPAQISGTMCGTDTACADIALPDVPPTTCSPQSIFSTTLTFENQCGGTVLVYWINTLCEEIFYAELRPGESWSSQTFVGYLWRVRNATTTNVLKEAAATTSPSTVSIP